MTSFGSAGHTVTAARHTSVARRNRLANAIVLTVAIRTNRQIFELDTLHLLSQTQGDSNIRSSLWNESVRIRDSSFENLRGNEDQFKGYFSPASLC